MLGKMEHWQLAQLSIALLTTFDGPDELTDYFEIVPGPYTLP